MKNYSDNNSICFACTFSPFCSAEEKKVHVNQINSAVKQHDLRRNEVLYFPQSTFRNLYVIMRGSLKTCQVDAEGNELIQGFYFVGEGLGFEAIYAGNYLFSAVALSQTVVCEIPYDNLLELLHSHPHLQKHILHLISQKLATGPYLFSVTAEQRLAAFLIDVSSRLADCKIQLEFSLPMSRQEIGSYLRLTAETISRLLSQFKEKNIISINHKKIQFLQFEKLKRIAGIYNS